VAAGDAAGRSVAAAGHRLDRVALALECPHERDADPGVVLGQQHPRHALDRKGEVLTGG
jgi:hypothetical protein